MAVNQTNNRVVWFLRFWLPVLGCMAFIFYVSSLPGKDIPSIFAFQDILFHATIYAILALFFYKAVKNTFAKLVVSRIIIFTVIFGLSYGITDEFHQLFVPGRSASGFDLIIDSAGSLVGSLIGVFFFR
jgi:VanZ family protein